MDGRQFADEYAKKVLKSRCKVFIERYERLPVLNSIVVGEHPAIRSYVRVKERYFDRLCMVSKNHFLPEKTSEQEVLSLLRQLNEDSTVDGILVHMPLPDHINEEIVIENIVTEKDVDGLSPKNIYAWVKDLPGLIPATALAAFALLKYYRIPIKGKHAVVIGRSTVIGKPVAHLVLREDATVTICHSKTKKLGFHTTKADILISAVGKPHLVNKEMVKPNAVVVDVGINKKNGKIVGDVDFKSIKDKVSYITPVPGGVGPVTVAMLASNLLLTFELQQHDSDENIQASLRRYYTTFDDFYRDSNP